MQYKTFGQRLCEDIFSSSADTRGRCLRVFESSALASHVRLTDANHTLRYGICSDLAPVGRMLHDGIQVQVLAMEAKGTLGNPSQLCKMHAYNEKITKSLAKPGKQSNPRPQQCPTPSAGNVSLQQIRSTS